MEHKLLGTIVEWENEKLSNYVIQSASVGYIFWHYYTCTLKEGYCRIIVVISSLQSTVVENGYETFDEFLESYQKFKNKYFEL